MFFVAPTAVPILLMPGTIEFVPELSRFFNIVIRMFPEPGAPAPRSSFSVLPVYGAVWRGFTRACLA
jgi:hypothetical protein